MSDINVQTFQGKVNISNNLKVGSGHLFVDTLNNQVGLNTNTPLANLHVNGNTYVHSDFRVGSGIVMDQKVATFGTPKTFVVEVVGGAFQIDGVSRPALTFHENQTYIFDQSHSSNSGSPGHPIAFSEAVNGGTPYATGVTSVGTPGQVGAKTTFKVPVGAPSNLFYYCVNHPTTMGSLVGAPSVVSTEAEVIVSGRLLATSIHGDGSALFNIPSSAINGTLSQWNDVNTNEIYYDLGNVGIGNQNPNSTLDVTGSGAFSTTLSVGGDLTVGTDKLFVDVSTGQVGVGTTTPAAGKALDVVGDLQATYLYGDGSNISNITSSQWVTTGNDIFYNTGGVRVGSNQAPTETLDVTGTGAFSDDLTVGTSKLVVDVSESRVGVNKAAPGYTLDVLGDINFTGDIRKGGVVQTFGGGGGGGGGVWTEVTGTTQIHYSTGNVGVANTNPQHTLSVGSNLYVDDAGSNVLVVDGNVAANQITLGQFEIVPSYGLDDVVNESNTTTKTVHLSNVTTGVITTSNALIGGELTVTGNVVASSNITVTGNVVVDDDLYLTSNAKLLVDSNVVTEYTGPHSRGEAKLKKYPEIVFEEGKFDITEIVAGSTQYWDGPSTVFQGGYSLKTTHHSTDSGGKFGWMAFDGNSESVWKNPEDYDTSGNYDYGYTGIQQRLTDTNSTNHDGDHVIMGSPDALKMAKVTVTCKNSNRRVVDYSVLGSNSSGTTGWTLLDSGTFTAQDVNTATISSPTSYFKYHAFVVRSVTAHADGTRFQINSIDFYGYEEDPPAGDTSVDTTFTSIMNTPQTTGANVYTDAKLSSDFTNQVTGPTPVGTAAVHDITNKYWEMNGQLTSNITVEANTFLEGDQPHTVSVWFNSSNLEANVSNTCVFSVSDQEKLDSVNLDLQSNTWHNLTYAYQGEGGSRVTYLDGRKVAEDQAEDTFGEYPPFAMTGYSQGGYVASASGELSSTDNSHNLFDKDISDSSLWTPSASGYNSSTGAANSTGSITLTNGVQGHWVQLDLPHKLKLNYVGVAASSIGTRYAKDATIFGSNDGVSWTSVGGWTDNAHASNTLKYFTMNGDSGYYNKYRMVITKNGPDPALTLTEWKLYGHRENDLVRLPDPTNVLKYPHIAMTGPAQRGYVASASSEHSDSTFDGYNGIQEGKLFDDDPATFWHTETNGTNDHRYDGTADAAGGRPYGAGSISNFDPTGINIPGEWVQLEFPHKLKISKVHIRARSNQEDQAPKDFAFYGSDTGSAGSWTLIQSFTGEAPQDDGTSYYAITSNPAHYKYILMLITRTVGTTAMSMAALQYFGTGVDSIPIQIGGGNIDKVANFRVYDKFVGEDQALEIWDAQKDEFGRAKSSMTLQKGRLGIGTDEPQGRLAVADEPRNLEEFPPRAMTAGETYMEGHGVFKASVSEYSGAAVHDGWNAFAHGAAEFWLMGDNAGYNLGSGEYEDNEFRLSSETSMGQWIKLEMPYLTNVTKFILQPRGPGIEYQAPKSGELWGSKDNYTWTKLHTFTDIQYYQGHTTFNFENSGFYKYYGLVVTKVVGGSSIDYISIVDLRYFGTREQGQSVLHDGELTLTKSLNVPRIGPALDADDTPRRDRLVVEYNTSTNPTFEGAVRDTSGRGNDGVFVGTATYDATEKAFTFPGSGMNTIQKYNLGSNLKGNQPLTVSLWFKTDDDRDQNLFGIVPGDRDEDNNTDNKVFGVRTEGDSSNYNLLFYYWNSDYRYNVPDLDNPHGKWFHLVVMNVGGTKTGSGTTFDRGDPSNRRLFLNGVELFTPSNTTYGSAVTGSATDLLDLEPNSRLIIGARFKDNGEYPFDGSISNFKLYNTALTTEEVKTLYDMGRMGNVIPKPLHVDTTLQVNGLFQGNSPLQFFVVNGQFPASGTSQTVTDLPQGLKDRIRQVVFIQGLTVQENGDNFTWIRHGSSTWEVDIKVIMNPPSILLSSFDATVNLTSKAWRIFVVTT